MCFGGGSSGSSGTNIYQTSTSLPGWVTDAAKANYGLATDVSNKPYQAYTDPRIAGFTPDQQQAFSQARTMQGQYQPAIDQALQTAGNVAGSNWTNANVGAYMDPYIGQVVGNTVGELNRQGDIQRADIGRAANAASAFGGSRHGVVEAEQMRNQNQQIANTTSQLYSDAFRNAQNQWNADRQSQLSGANALGSLAGQGQNIGMTDLNALLTTGGSQQTLNQANMDQAYADFLRQQQYPMEMLNYRMSALTNTPYTTSTTQQMPAQTANPWAQGLGAFTTGIGALGALGVFG